MKIYITILFCVGVFLLAASLFTSQVFAGNSVLLLIILGLGLVCILSSIIAYLYTSKGFWQMRSTEATTNALVSTVAVIFIVTIVNYLAIKYPLQVDLTENQLFTLSPQSQELVKDLEQPVQVYIFDSNLNQIDRDLLDSYSRYNDLFTYELVNPQVDIALAQQFNVTRNGDVYLTYEDRQRLVQIVSPENRLAETKLTTAISLIQKENNSTIYILQGHGEPLLQQQSDASFTQLAEALTNQGYTVQGINLSNSPLVPPSATVLLVSSATRQLSAEDVSKIEHFVDRGGSVLVMYNAQVNNSVDSLLQTWGVSLDESLAIDASGTGDVFGYGPSVSFIINYGSHPITEDFSNVTVLPWARPITVTPQDDVEATPLLISSELSWGETNLEAQNVEFNDQQDVPPPLNLAVALVKRNVITIEDEPNSDNNQSDNQVENEQNSNLNSEESVTSENQLPQPPTIQNPQPQKSGVTSGNKTITQQRMLVIGNSNFATDGWFSQQLNSDFILNSIAWLSNEDENTLSIRPKQVTNRRLNVTPQQVTIVSWLALLIVPGLSLIAAITTWWQRSK